MITSSVGMDIMAEIMGLVMVLVTTMILVMITTLLVAMEWVMAMGITVVITTSGINMALNTRVYPNFNDDLKIFQFNWFHIFYRFVL